MACSSKIQGAPEKSLAPPAQEAFIGGPINGLARQAAKFAEPAIKRVVSHLFRYQIACAYKCKEARGKEFTTCCLECEKQTSVLKFFLKKSEETSEGK